MLCKMKRENEPRASATPEQWFHGMMRHLGANTYWLIQRTNSRMKPWFTSLAFPISVTHSALEFFTQERRNLRRDLLFRPDESFGGIRLVLFTRETSVVVASKVVNLRRILKPKPHRGGRCLRRIRPQRGGDKQSAHSA